MVFIVIILTDLQGLDIQINGHDLEQKIFQIILIVSRSNVTLVCISE
jgi:hypothetical protein